MAGRGIRIALAATVAAGVLGAVVIAGRAWRAPAPYPVEAGAAAPVAAAGALSPEETVGRYLDALKERRLDEAYDLVSAAMRQGKGREVWVKEQQAGMAFAEVKIFEFEVHPGKIQGDTAQVPNVLSSQDRFINQLGLTEYELYTLVREDGAWKVDRQVIVEPGDLAKWFPRKGSTETAEPPVSH